MAIGKVNVKLNALSHRKASSAVLLARASVFGAFSPFFVDIRKIPFSVEFWYQERPYRKIIYSRRTASGKENDI